MFNYLQKKGLLFACLCLGLSPLTAFGQACDGQEGALPDTPVEVGGDGSVAGNPEVTCFYFRFDSDITGWPTGITMDLWHEYEGDLGIFIEACGERLNILQRPGAVGNCDPECAFNIPDGDCGSSAMIGSEGNPEIVSFYDTGTEPDDGISMGGTFGVTQDDACGVGTVSTFVELWSGCPEGLVEAEICFADHASLHRGFVSNLNFIFPNPYTCGCMDEDALNYDEDASVSSGDCIYECQDWIVEVPTTTIDLCQGVDTLMLSANAPEADNPTYEWIGTGNSNSFLEDAESAQTAVYIPEDFVGTIIYTVTAMDEYACPQSEAVTITVSPAATVDIGGPTTICGSDSTDLVLAGGPFTSVQWSTGAQTENIRVGAGSYEVTVTADGLCPATDVIDVIAFATPDPIISGPDTICFTDTVQLTVDTSFVSYTWSTGDTLSAIQANLPSTYALMVVDSNGCVGVDTFQLNHFDSLQLLLPETAAFCPGENVTLEAPADLFSYQWSNGDTTVQTTTATAGVLSLMAVDSSGCNLTQEVQVEALAAPQPQIVGPPALCPDETVALVTSIPYAAYEWSDNEQDSILITDQVGTYSVLVTDDFGCTGSTTYDLEAAQQIDLTVDFPTQICPEDNATVEASAGFMIYEWSTGDSTAMITVPGTGDYQLTVTSPEGCVQSTDLSITPHAIVAPEITGDDELCPDEVTTLVAAAGYTNYVWGDGTTGAQLEVNAEGVYTLQATDSNGCAVTASYAVQELTAPTVEILGDALICEDGNGALQATTGLASYAWSVANETSADLTVNAPGTYSVTVADQAGCTATASFDVGLSIPQPQILGENAFCLGESTVLTVVDTFSTYQWSGGVDPTTNMLTVDAPGEYFLTVTNALGCSGQATIDVTENPLPEPVITGDAEFCFGESTVLNAGAGFQSYEWSVPGNTSQFLEVSTGATFSVTVTDNNGCMGSTQANTQVNPLPNPQITGDLIFCQGAETILSSTEEYQSYSWSNGGQGQSTTVNTNATISLTVVDDNACEATVSAQPDFFPVNTPQITGDLNLCLNGTTTLTANPGFVSYEWSDGQSGPQATFDNAGSVTLTVEDNNGCVTERQALLDNYPVEPLNVIPAATFCAGESAELTAAGNFVSYQWSNQDSTATITISQPGTYVVTATDFNGCTVIAEGSAVEYDLPEPEIDGLLRFCAGFNTTLSTTEDYVQYQWSDNSTNPEITIGTAGLVGVTVTDANGCVGSTNADLETVSDLDPVVLNPGGFCPGGSVELTVEEPYLTYDWSNGGEEASISVNTPGNFTVSVTAAGGCTGETTVEVVAFSEPSLAIIGQDNFCAGESVTLTASGDAGELVWSTSSNETEILVEEPGLYTLSLTDANGCTTSDQITLTELPLPVFDLQGDTTFCAGLNTTLSTTPSFPTYVWSSGSGAANITLSTSTDVSVTVTDANGCSASQSTAVLEIVLPVADAGAPQDLDCDTDSVTLGGDGSSTGSSFLYTWTGPGINAGNQNDEFPEVTVDGTYTLEITDLIYNCVSTISTVEVADLSYTPLAVVTATDQLDCVTSLVMVDGTGSDTGSQYVYEWLDENGNTIPGATNLQIEVSEAQLYTLVVRDTETACVGQASDAVDIDTNYPVISFADPAELNCSVSETTISAMVTSSGIAPNILWTPGVGANILSPATNENIDINAPGWYVLEVSDPSNGCVTLDSVQVSQNVTPPTVVTNGNQMLFCNDESVTLSGQGSSNGGNVSYQWLYNGVNINGATNLEYAATEPGSYTLVITNNNNGCTANNGLEVSLDPTAPQLFELAFDPPTCEGDRDASLWVNNIEGGMSPYMYSFNGQGFSAATNYNNLYAGTYELTVEDANGCQLTSLVEIPDGNNVSVDLGPDQTIAEGEPASIYPQVSIDPSLISRLDWNVAFDLPCPDCLIQEDLYLEQATRFFLKITDENGCSAEDNVLILIEKKQDIYVPNGFSPNGDGRNDRFYIFTDPNSVEEIEVLRIFNRWGEFVWENTNFQPNDPTQGWDGRVGGMDPNPAVFVWYAQIKMRSGETLLLKGDVTLVE